MPNRSRWVQYLAPAQQPFSPMAAAGSSSTCRLCHARFIPRCVIGCRSHATNRVAGLLYSTASYHVSSPPLASLSHSDARRILSSSCAKQTIDLHDSIYHLTQTNHPIGTFYELYKQHMNPPVKETSANTLCCWANS
jgi:hypothetical protein